MVLIPKFGLIVRRIFSHFYRLYPIKCGLFCLFKVIWKPSTVEFADRFDKYLDPSFFQHRIHWFSIFNSFMMVIFLVGLVSMILLRTLRKDYARYSKDDELDEMVSFPFYQTS